MSFKQLANYLNLILAAQLLSAQYDGYQLLFKTTSKGRHFLETYMTLKSLIEQPSITTIHPKTHER
jgi:predicted transcriptional regulator